MSIKLTPEQALAYAQASQRIEGLTMSADAVELTRKMLNGEISYDDARAQLLANAKANAQQANARDADS